MSPLPRRRSSAARQGRGIAATGIGLENEPSTVSERCTPMSKLRLLCLGVGDAFSALHYSSCFALESDSRWLLVDCPHPIRKIAREGAHAAGVAFELAQIDALILTHLHGDHVSG